MDRWFIRVWRGLTQLKGISWDNIDPTTVKLAEVTDFKTLKDSVTGNTSKITGLLSTGTDIPTTNAILSAHIDNATVHHMPMTATADSTATTVVLLLADHNALLAKLRLNGYMAP
jgi:hypothetical protein